MRTLDLLSILLRLGAGAWLVARIVRPAAARVGHRPCAIVVPARNEARTLPALLGSLVDQLGPDDELLVVDDHSDDATAAVAAAAGAVVVPAPPLPGGWVGKSWACWTGVRRTSCDLLVFLDADTALEPGGLDRLVAAHAERGGLVSVQPFHTVPRPYERLSAFFNVVSMMGSDAFTPLGARRPPTGAFGPALLVERSVYLDVGGHAAIADELLDDVALAQAHERAGHAVTVLGGRGTIRFRMYPDGVRHLVEGWSKNMAGGAARTRLSTLVLITAWVSLCINAAWWLGRLPLDTSASTADVQLGVVAYAAVAAQLWWVFRRIGTFGPATAVLFPVPLVFFLLVFCRSIVRTALRGSVEWKGRQIATRERPAA